MAKGEPLITSAITPVQRDPRGLRRLAAAKPAVSSRLGYARFDQKLIETVARRLSGSLTPSGVGTARSVLPFQSTFMTDWATPRPTMASATALARRSDRRRLYLSPPDVSVCPTTITRVACPSLAYWAAC